MSFASLKKASSKGDTFAKLTREIDKLNQPAAGSSADERFWKPELDKSGNGYAVIRFLPAPDGEEMPWAKVWSHAFNGPGGQWYIENSLTTLGKDDPVGEMNRELWNSGRDSDKEVARAQKRKLSYYANIYVVSDPAHPEKEGQVFLYKFGKKIFDKLVEAMQPAFADETPTMTSLSSLHLELWVTLRMINWKVSGSRVTLLQSLKILRTSNPMSNFKHV